MYGYQQQGAEVSGHNNGDHQAGHHQDFMGQSGMGSGLLEKVYSNRGPQFVLTFMKELYGMLRVEGNLSSAYQPQMDRQTEQLNQELEKYL
jgi:hypothetical protein